MYIGRWVYNTLSRWARGIVTKMRQLRKDVLLIVLTVTLTAFAAIVPAIVKTNWSIVTITMYLIVILALLFMMWTVLGGLLKMYEKEDVQRKEETKQRKEETTQLINDTVEKTLKDLGLKK